MKATYNIQDVFLNQLRKDAVPTTVFLISGYQLRGLIKSFDNFTVILESKANSS